jgi:hypothetical protein
MTTLLSKVVINLAKPQVAKNESLPHAAMMLGSPRGIGLAPPPKLVARLIIESALGAWVFHRLDVDGGFVGDSWHESREDALWQAKREFGVEAN